MPDYLDFHHDVGFCGGHFQTKITTLCDFPEKVICPACHGGGDPERRVAAMKRLAAAIVELRAAEADLEKGFNLRLVNFFPRR